MAYILTYLQALTPIFISMNYLVLTGIRYQFKYFEAIFEKRGYHDDPHTSTLFQPA